MKLSYFKELVTQQDPTLGAHRDTELWAAVTNKLFLFLNILCLPLTPKKLPLKKADFSIFSLSRFDKISSRNINFLALMKANVRENNGTKKFAKYPSETYGNIWASDMVHFLKY